MSTSEPGARSDLPGVAALGAIAFALCDSLHEVGHLLAAMLPQQGSVISISSVGVSTTTSSPVVAIAGPSVNVLLAAAITLAPQESLHPSWRLFAWLFGTVNLFNAVAYLVYSAVLGTGDWATVFDSIDPPRVWRPLAGVVGVALYAGAVLASFRVLRRLVVEAVVSQVEASRCCLSAYWVGGLLLVAASALNPISPRLILTSGVATGFGAMFGLVIISRLLSRIQERATAAPPIEFGRSWVFSGALVSLVFIVVLGRGIHLSAGTAGTVRAEAPDPSVTAARVER